MKKLLTTVPIMLMLFLFSSASAGATGCEPIYGGGPTCTDTTLTIQKQVLDPTTNHFVHNLGLSDPKYHSNDLITFQIVLTNNGSKPIEKVIIKDTFPSQLSFSDGPGQFDTNTHILTFTVQNIAPHHSQLFTVTGRVSAQSKFPVQTTFCTTNQVSALPSSGTIVQDSSQFCIQKLTSTPATGPEALELLALFPMALAGIFLRSPKFLK